jgi:hypothetical protein
MEKKPDSSSKKFRPRWGKPVITGVKKRDASPATDSSGAAAAGVSKKKFRPRWGKPMIVSSSKADQPALGTSPAQISSVDINLAHREPEETMHIVSHNPDLGVTGRQTPPSDNTAPINSEYHPPITVKASGKNIRAWVVAAVVCLCVAGVYWYYQTRHSEKIMSATTVSTDAGAEGNSLHARVEEEVKVAPEVEIRDLLMKWLDSWQTTDIEAYRGFYAPDFRAKGMDLGAWVSHKTLIFRKSKNISIRMENLRISVDGNNATAEFTQYYSSSISRSSDKKILKLKKIGKEWKIYSEIS